MKSNRTLLIAVLSLCAASSLTAEQQAKEEIPGVAPQPAHVFYTGRPFDEDLGAYTFRYRNYDPEINRWTSFDPSGFPDGANNQIYSAVPTTQLDYGGLLTIGKYLGTGTIWQYQLPNGQDGIMVNVRAYEALTKANNMIIVYEPIGVLGHDDVNYPHTVDMSSNCHGFTFLGGGYIIGNSSVATILADEYQVCTEAEARIVVYGNNEHSVTVVAHDANGNITLVNGKDGHLGAVQTTLGGTGYSSSPAFYE